MSNQAARKHRNSSIRRAVSTSLLSKGSTALLQFVSLPLAARVLGRAEFGIYSTISLAVLVIAILQLGVGPALGRSISEAAANGNRKQEGRLFSNGALLIVSASMIGLLIAAIVITTVPVPVLFGAEYAPFAESMRPALWTGLFLMVGLLLVEMTDRVREGYMETDSVNASSTAGNLAGAILVFTGIQHQPSVSFLLIAVFGPNILARFVNTLFLLRKRPWLLAEGLVIDRKIQGALIRDGLSFSATSFVVYLTEFSICALIIGRISGPDEVAVFEILMAVTTAFTGMLLMVGRPIWSALVDAKSKGDGEWMESASLRYYGYLALLSVPAAIGLIGFGPWVIRTLYGPEFVIDRIVFVGHVIFLVSVGWRHVNRYLAIGLGLIGQTVLPMLAGLALGMLLGIGGLREYGIAGLFAGLSVGALLIPGISIPRLVWKTLKPASTSLPGIGEGISATGKVGP
jgi:O-antigen/teichoic acid export membrane protein